MKAGPLALALAMVWAAAGPAAGQTAQETNKTPANEAMKVAGIADVYIGMMENCNADTTAIRAHYRARIAKTAGDDGRDKARALFGHHHPLGRRGGDA